MESQTVQSRGVIEGFLGPIWSHEDRLHLIRHLRGWNMNIFIYSPRDDPCHRFCWDAPYPAEDMARFIELAKVARRQGVQFAYGISPGNTFRPRDPAHRLKLLDKPQPFIDLGSTFFPILYDDLQGQAFPAGLVLSQWFTAEWAEYRSSEENLPPLGDALTPAQRDELLARLREIFLPLGDFGLTSNRTRKEHRPLGKLNGKAAIVTGVTSGVGRGIAELLAAEGAAVVIGGQNEERGAEVVAVIRKRGGAATFVAGIVSPVERRRVTHLTIRTFAHD